MVRSLSLLGLCVLVACGGGAGRATPSSPAGPGSEPSPGGDDPGTPPGGVTPPTPLRIAGKVIDGYVKGAHVYLDLDFDSEWDPGEPEAVTGEAGDYALELSAALRECAEHVPLVVDVPVGAVDADAGSVESAYQMVRPPLFAPIGEGDSLHVTPLTTALWNAMEAELVARPEAFSCDTVVADARTRQELVDTLELAVANTVRHYNVSRERLFADFVAAGDTSSATAAREIVRGLQQSVVDTVGLRRAYPGSVVFVDYHKGDYRDGDWLYPEAWYRETNLFFETTSRFELVKVSADLSHTLRTIIYGERTRDERPDHAYALSYEYESRGGDASPYGCDIKEIVSTTSGGISYELVNLVSKAATVFEDCVPATLADAITHRYLGVDYAEEGTRYSAQFIYRRAPSGFALLPDWLDLRERHGTLAMGDLVAAVGTLPYRYEDDVPADSVASSWVKRKTYSEGGNTVSISKSSSGTFEKRTTYPDDTYSLECSTDDVTWTRCD